MVDSDARSADELPPAPKNIVICLDGTNNLLDSHPTNAAKIFMMLDLDHPKEQLAYYDPGVGTLPASGAIGKIGKALSQLGGLAFGFGMQTNVIQAYSWLMDRYRPGDRVYIFGFSRGAYTARALTGMLAKPGMLRAGSDNLVEYAVKEYVKPVRTQNAREKRASEAKAFADALCWGTPGQPVAVPPGSDRDEFLDALGASDIHAVPVQYLGIWDTVESWFGGLRSHEWAQTYNLSNVRRLRHAISIDEWRAQFRPSPVKPSPRFEEMWFSGVHCDVGGTFENNDLARIALKWVFEGIGDELLLRDGEWERQYRAFCTVVQGLADGRNAINKDPWVYRLIGTHNRKIPADAVLHSSVRMRCEADPAYRLRRADAAAEIRWGDETWTDFVPTPGGTVPAAELDESVADSSRVNA